MSGELASERVVVQAPMSFTGSAQRLARIPHHAGLILIPFAWVLVLAWYVLFGLLLVPYRLLRRGSRRRKRDELRHREVLAAVHNDKAPRHTEV